MLFGSQKWLSLFVCCKLVGPSQCHGNLSDCCMQRLVLGDPRSESRGSKPVALNSNKRHNDGGVVGLEQLSSQNAKYKIKIQA